MGGLGRAVPWPLALGQQTAAVAFPSKITLMGLASLLLPLLARATGTQGTGSPADADAAKGQGLGAQRLAADALDQTP